MQQKHHSNSYDMRETARGAQNSVKDDTKYVIENQVRFKYEYNSIFSFIGQTYATHTLLTNSFGHSVVCSDYSPFMSDFNDSTGNLTMISDNMTVQNCSRSKS